MLSEHEQLACAFCGDTYTLVEIDCNGEELMLRFTEGWGVSTVFSNGFAKLTVYCPLCFEQMRP